MRYFNQLCGLTGIWWRYAPTERPDDYPHSIPTKIPKTTETIETRIYAISVTYDH
jgi:hypothetical protein